MVDTGPTVPTCDATLAPSRSMPAITANTGNTVQTVAFNSDSPYTGAGSANSKPVGRVTTKCSTQHSDATQLA